MGEFTKAAALGVIVSILAVLIRRYSKEQALMLTLVTTGMILLTFFSFFRAIRELLRDLEDATGVDSALLVPVYKCLLISMVSHFAAGICKDASETAIAQSITTLGIAAGVYVCLPLFFSVLSLIRQLMEVGG